MNPRLIHTLKLCLLALIILTPCRTAAADVITLEWDPIGAPALSYKLYVGTQPGTYTQQFDVGTATTFTFTEAVAGQRYCFAVTTYVDADHESGKSNEVCGSSNAPPALTNPGNQSSAVGQANTLQLLGSDPEGQALTFGATGLPPGISVQASTGFISGSATTAGSYPVTVSANDGVVTSSQSFTWTVGSSSTPPPTTPPSSTVTLTAQKFDRPTRDSVRLTWTAAQWSGAWIVRNNTLLTETGNDGSFTDTLRQASGTYTYAVCAPGATSGSSCSNPVTVQF